MSALKLLGIVLGGLAALTVLVVVVGIIVIQTDWFRDTARERIETAIEGATGGEVEIGGFDFDWRNLRIEIRNFVLRGTESRDLPPLFRARLIRIDLGLFTAARRPVEIQSVLVDEPQGNVIVYEDGSTNIPGPEPVEREVEREVLRTLVDLAIGRFELVNGFVLFGDRRIPLNARGRNLRAQLFYDQDVPAYKGQVAMTPLELQTGTREQLDVTLTVPLVLERNRILFDDAAFTTAQSRLSVSGAITDMKDARIDARVQGHIDLAEAQQLVDLNLRTTGDVPRVLYTDANVHIQDELIRISDTRIALGQTEIRAEGVLRDETDPAGVDFKGTVEVGEIARLLRLPLQPAGTAQADGSVVIEDGEYLVRAGVNARSVAFTLGGERFTDVTLVSGVRVQPGFLELTGTRLGIMGGTFTGRATVDAWDRFQASGRIAGFDARMLADRFADLELPWGATLSGPVQARGQLRAAADLWARGNLTLTPLPSRGIPARGRVNAVYDGAADTIRFAQSWVALPRSRVEFAGVLGQRLNVQLVSRDLDEVAMGVDLPVELNGGTAAFNGAVLGELRAPRVTGRVRLTNFRLEDRPFNLLAANIDLSESQVAAHDGVLSRGALDARFNATLGLRRYRTYPQSPIAVNAVVRNADLRDALAVAGEPGAPAAGTLNASAQITGTLGSPRGEIAADVLNGRAWGQPFDRAAVRAYLQEGLINVPTLWVGFGPARISGELAYNYTPGELRRGTLTGQVAGSNVQLAQVRPLTERRPTLDGAAAFNANFAVTVQPAAGETDFDLARLDANLAVRGLEMHGEQLGDLTATARTAGNVVDYAVNSNFAGSTIKVAGRTALAPNYPTEATAQIDGLPLEPTLAVAGYPEVDATGNLDAGARFSGSLAAPQANANVRITEATFEEIPIERVEAALNVTDRLIQVPTLVVQSGDARIRASARLAHPGDYRTGDLQFQVASNRFELQEVPAAQALEPGLAGAVEARAEGAATLRAGDTPLIDRLNALVTADEVHRAGARVGDLYAVAQTRAGDLVFNVRSDFAGADIRAAGTMGLTGDYPLNAELTFGNLTYAGIEPFVPLGRRPNFDAIAAGRATVAGPAARPEALRGRIEITRLDMYSVVTAPGVPERRALQVRAAEPIVLTFDRLQLQVETARLIGPFANLDITGGATLRAPYPLNLRATGEFRLELVEAFLEDAFAAGTAVLNAAVRGTARDPSVIGRVDLRDANFNMIGWPAGLSEADGTIVFTGRQAVIQQLAGLVGGGKVALSGSVGFAGPEWNFRIQADARDVRVQYPQNVSTAMNADISLTGTTARSVLAGDVTILDVAFYTNTDVGSIFAGAARPVAVPRAETGFLAGMRLDLRVETAPDAQFRTTLTENIEALLRVQVRGTAASPGALGRLDVTQGEVDFFGTRYNIDQGSVAFYDPNRLEPIVNIDLTTRAGGIDVTLTVSGPIDRLQLTYRSDPPLQFDELVSLLATGSVPTTDPVLVAREPVQPQQTFQQMGASTLLGQAVASPVAGRLQRLFGVTRLRIDPQIVGAENVAQARFTLQQQVTRDLLFTYIQDVTEGNPEMIRVEWTFDPTWSAVIQRQENGAAGLDLFWRRRFR